MSVRRNIRGFENFRERKATRARTVTFDLPSSAWVMGKVDFIGYRTTHGKRSVRYKHTFHAGSMPLLATDGKVLLLIGGRFHVTDRGIVDLDRRGRENE